MIKLVTHRPRPSSDEQTEHESSEQLVSDGDRPFGGGDTGRLFGRKISLLFISLGGGERRYATGERGRRLSGGDKRRRF